MLMSPSGRDAFQPKTLETVDVLEESIAEDFQGHNNLLIRLLLSWIVKKIK